MTKDLFDLAAPLQKTFGVEPYAVPLGSVHVAGESFLHEMCHVVTLEKRGIRVPLPKAFGSRAFRRGSLSNLLGDAIDTLPRRERAKNECEAWAVEILLLEAYGHLDIFNQPEDLGPLLRRVWNDQPSILRRTLFNRSFRRFVVHLLELRDEDWIRESAKKVIRRTHYWRKQ